MQKQRNPQKSASDAIRTHDTHFRRVVLYPLSYRGRTNLHRHKALCTPKVYTDLWICGTGRAEWGTEARDISVE